MYNGKTTIGVITARGGSKGIPRKNIKPLSGKPLLAYTVEAAQRSKLLTRCIVSTEDEEIAAIARSLGAAVPFLRPAELAGDRSTSVEALQHALKWLKEKEGKTYDYVMILQPTSPLRTAEDIDACIRKAVDTDADSVMSMTALIDLSLPKLKRIENDRILPAIADEGPVSAFRDASETFYKRNTAIYLTRTALIERGDMFGAVSRPYIMPAQRSLDINEPADFELAEFWLKKSHA